MRQSSQAWTVNHLKRQKVLVWLMLHHVISETMGERIDALDNQIRERGLNK